MKDTTKLNPPICEVCLKISKHKLYIYVYVCI